MSTGTVVAARGGFTWLCGCLASGFTAGLGDATYALREHQVETCRLESAVVGGA